MRVTEFAQVNYIVVSSQLIIVFTTAVSVARFPIVISSYYYRLHDSRERGTSFDRTFHLHGSLFSLGSLANLLSVFCNESQSNKRREVVEKQKQNKFSAGGSQVSGYGGRRRKRHRLRQSWSQPASGQPDSLSGLASFLGRGRSVDASSIGGSSANPIERYLYCSAVKYIYIVATGVDGRIWL